MWPIALPHSKVVHLSRLAWATVVVSVNQYKSRQGHAAIKSQRLSSISVAYPKQIQSEYVKGMDTNRLRYQAYWLRIQSEYVKRMGTTRQRFQACRLRIGCVSKANTSKGWIRIDCSIKRIGCVLAAYPRCVVEAHDRQTDFFRMMTVV
jgi:hypothetical protein